MKTLSRICIKTHTITAQNGDSMTVERGKEYITTPEREGEVVVFGRYWHPFPAQLFASAEEFTS